jgi:tetratricopeptide (TPR) repeat protein
MQPPARRQSSLLPLLPGAFVALVTVLVHSPGLFNQLVNWDDAQYVILCTQVHGLTWENFRFFLTTPYFANYHPVTSFSFMGDHAIWGLDPTGWHLTNILLHGLNSVWVYLLALALLRPRTLPEDDREPSPAFSPVVLGAVAAALIYSLHPLRVEVAAWVSARKDLVCAAFFLPSLLLWLRYIRTESRTASWLPYVACLILFFLALMSKPMAITLPLVLLLLDTFDRRPLCLRLLVEKVPFFALSALSAIITLWAQTEGGALREDLAYDWWIKAQTVTYGFVFYIGQWFWPVSLSPIYAYGSAPHPILPGAAAYAPFLLVLLGILAAACAWRSRLWAFAWGMYFIMLLPVVQMIPIGNAYAADRYTYLPMVGLSIALGAGLQSLIARRGLRSPATAAALAATASLLVIWSIQSIQYTRAWRTDKTLWTHAISHHPSSIAYANLASDQVRSYQGRKALEYVDKAIYLNPKNHMALSTRGSAQMMMGDMESAVESFQAAIAINPKFEAPYTNLGYALLKLERYTEAIAVVDRALETNVNPAPGLLTRATARERLGLAEQAMEDLEKAAALDPKLGDIPIVRARILIRKNQLEEAKAILRVMEQSGKSLPDDLKAILQEPSGK